jgi:hypothetical protein
MQLGEGNDNTTELAVQFWTRPDDQVIECLVERLDDEFGAVRKRVWCVRAAGQSPATGVWARGASGWWRLASPAWMASSRWIEMSATRT